VFKAITSEHLDWYNDTELLEKLITAATTLRDEAFLGVLGKGGLHITEAVRLAVPDVGFERESLSILSLRRQTRIRCLTCSEKLAKKYSFCPACGNKVTQVLREENEQRYQRIIPIDCGTLDSIKRYLEWRRRFPYRGELLFPFTRQRAWQIVEKLGRRIGLKGLHPESLRQLLAVRWVKKGLDVKKLKYLLGYASMAAHPPSFSFEQLKLEYQKLWETGKDEA
jgi:site-specific recombinase XerD